jgi:glutamate carboxypeptidase
MGLAALAQAVASLRPAMLERLQTLVAIESGSHNGPGIDAAGDRLEALWRGLGFIAARQRVGATGDLRRFSRGTGAPGRLLILGHLDTVWPAGTTADWPFAITGDTATGPGIGDMKSGLVMAHAAIEALLAVRAKTPGEIRMLLVPDEELGSPASRPHIEAEADWADWVLVMEPARPDGSVIAARGAVGALYATAQGTSAHVLNRGTGASAISHLAGKISALEALTDANAGTGISIGIIRGGDARQVIPRHCELHIDLRAPTAAAAETLLAQVAEILASPGVPGVTVTLSGGITRPAFPQSTSAALYARAARIAADLAIPYGATTTQGGSDGSFAAARGRPTLDGLGPICLETCSRRERILLPSLYERTLLLAALIADLAANLESPPTWH